MAGFDLRKMGLLRAQVVDRASAKIRYLTAHPPEGLARLHVRGKGREVDAMGADLRAGVKFVRQKDSARRFLHLPGPAGNSRVERADVRAKKLGPRPRAAQL